MFHLTLTTQHWTSCMVLSTGQRLHGQRRLSLSLETFNTGNMRKVLPKGYQHPTRGGNTLDHVYSPFRHGYIALLHPPFCKPDHISLLLSVYKQKLKRVRPVHTVLYHIIFESIIFQIMIYIYFLITIFPPGLSRPPCHASAPPRGGTPPTLRNTGLIHVSVSL